MTPTFVGGRILGAASNLRADQSAVYGTADYCSACAPTTDIYISQAISTVSFFLINGNTVTAIYDTTDDEGDLQTTTLVSNQNGGVGSVTSNDPPILHVNIAAGLAPGGCCNVDFFADNFTLRYCEAHSVRRVVCPPATDSADLKSAGAQRRDQRGKLGRDRSPLADR
jgi:hypothetical protein